MAPGPSILFASTSTEREVMRLQLDLGELETVLRTYTEALESKSRTEGMLWKEQERNAQLERDIRGLNSRIDNMSRGGSGAFVPGTMEAMSQARVNEMLIKVCGAVASGNKINAIKLVREYTQLGLKEAKDVVEGTAARVSGW
jgi:hypothetical protein